MVREVIQIQVGQCGNQIGTKFWEKIAQEHSIYPDGTHHGDFEVQLRHIDSFFRETRDGKYIPRSIFADLDPFSVDQVRGSRIGQMFSQDNYIYGNASASNNYAKGYYTDGKEQSSEILDAIRKEVEVCDSLHAFQFVHSIAGGTGSGLGSLLISNLKDKYQGKIISSFTHFPSSVSDTVVEPYNCILSMNKLFELADENFCIDNKALYDICTKKLRIKSPVFSDLNNLVSLVMSDITSSLRFPGQLNNNFRKLAVNLTPFHRLHFFIVEFAPLLSRESQSYELLTVNSILNDTYKHNNVMIDCNIRDGLFLSSAYLFRGKLSTYDIDYEVCNMKSKLTKCFYKSFINNISTSICNIPQRGIKTSATFIGNTTAIKKVFQQNEKLFDSMFSKKAFIHWYIDEGAEIGEFEEALNNNWIMIDDYSISNDFSSMEYEYEESEGSYED